MIIQIIIGSLTFSIIPSIDTCLILKGGKTIWSGNKNELEELLKNVRF